MSRISVALLPSTASHVSTCAGYSCVRRRITHESLTHKIEWVARWLQIRAVFRAFVRRVRGLALRMAERAEEAMRTVARPAPMVGGLVRDAVRSRDELIAENALLRQQLLVARGRSRSRGSPRTSVDFS